MAHEFNPSWATPSGCTCPPPHIHAGEQDFRHRVPLWPWGRAWRANQSPAIYHEAESLVGTCPARPGPDALHTRPLHGVTQHQQHVCTPTHHTCQCREVGLSNPVPINWSWRAESRDMLLLSDPNCHVSHERTDACTCTHILYAHAHNIHNYLPHIETILYTASLLFFFFFLSFPFFFGYSLPFFNCYNLYQHIMLNNYRERSSL